MRSNRPRFAGIMTLAFAFVVTGTVSALAQKQTQKVPDGQSMKIQGIVSMRSADSFTMRDMSKVETVVALTSKTDVKTHKKGVFRGGKEYGVSYILRGLRVEVEGVGNAEGQLVAKSIKFDEDDLRTAQALEQTDEMARENQARITAEEENAKKLAGQIAENQELTAQAQRAADLANKRINGLDEFDPVKTITVLFATGSSVLGPKGKAQIDKEAAWVKTQNTKGWVVAVVGFADKSGNTEPNRKLSERRANAVIGYLVTKHNLPLQRLVQPFGYGENKPAADDSTAEGRAKNRRVEIRLLVNKGIAGTT